MTLTDYEDEEFYLTQTAITSNSDKFGARHILVSIENPKRLYNYLLDIGVEPDVDNLIEQFSQEYDWVTPPHTIGLVRL